VLRRLWLAAVLIGPLLGSGCQHLPWRGRAVPECPGELVSSEAIPGEFLLRQRWRVERGDEAWSLEVVAQKRGDELVVVGLHPFGAKLFAIRQRGLETSVEAVPAPALEVPPLNVLRDLHRARFLGVAGAGGDGRFEAEHDGTEILEERDAGRVRWRSFRSLAGDPAGLVTLRFGEPAEGGEAVTVDNGWCGYRAEITTWSAQASP
jgi:uncharacterized protein DUF3261